MKSIKILRTISPRYIPLIIFSYLQGETAQREPAHVCKGSIIISQVSWAQRVAGTRVKHHSWDTPYPVLDRGLQVERISSLYSEARLEVGNLGPVCRVGG